MNLKQALLAALDPEQLKTICSELEVDADRRSHDAMVAALASAKRAKPEVIIVKLTVPQLRATLKRFEQPTGGKEEELIQRLLAAFGRSSAASEQRPDSDAIASSAVRSQAPAASDLASEYRHKDQAVQRPDVGVQDQFQAKKPPRVYRYDSSLDPELSWDEQRERELGEWLLGLIMRASKEGEAVVFAEPQAWKGGGVRVSSLTGAAQMLQQIAKPFLNWAGKAERHEIRVPTAPLFVHERHSTKAVLDSIRHRKARGQTLDLFADPGMDIRENLEAYEHKGPWQNRMILGDSLSVMNSLLEFEGLGGQVQMIYIDPPYGVKFGSNFQPFVRKRDVKHGGDEDMTREPEMVKAYRDTWELGLHSYLSYLRDRLLVARELLADSGSVFVQISDDNLHLVTELLSEVFGAENFVVTINFVTANAQTGGLLENNCNYIVWFAKDRSRAKYRSPLLPKSQLAGGAAAYRFVELPGGQRRPMTPEEREDHERLPEGSKIFRADKLTSSHPPGDFPVELEGRSYLPRKGYWSTGQEGMNALKNARRLIAVGDTLSYVRFLNDFAAFPIGSQWNDTITSGFASEKLYAVQTNTKVVQRCILMTSDPGDLVLDPTCGSGTTAWVAELWGRRWITIDISRVPLALARQRLLTATFPYYKLKTPQAGPAGGFVYERKQNRKGEEVGGLIPHITLKSVANNEPPVMEVLVDRPEEASSVTRVSGPFVVEASIAPVQPLETAGDDAAVDGDVSTHIQRMTEVLRQSKTLHLPGNRELTLASVRRTVDTEVPARRGQGRRQARGRRLRSGRRCGIDHPGLRGRARGLLSEIRAAVLFWICDRTGRACDDRRRKKASYPRRLRGRDTGCGDVGPAEDHARLRDLFDHRPSRCYGAAREEEGAERAALYEVELKGLDLFDPRVLGHRVCRW